MRGHESIIALRRTGLTPRYVWVSDFRHAFLDGMTVRLSPTDQPEQLDFRFLVGLTAIVEGQDGAKAARIAAACGVEAKRVIASVHGRWDVESVTDTDEVLTWPT